jgi:hypothetical protein
MPSAARSAKQPEPFVFFLDRGLGRHVICDALRGAGEHVEVHDDHFGQRTPDMEWLPAIAQRNWIAITKDTATRFNELMILAATNVRVAAFILGRSDATGDRMAGALLGALPSIKTALRRFPLPIIARVTLESAVHVHRSGTDTFKPPKSYKAPRLRPVRG